jgi:hypothetical protein
MDRCNHIQATARQTVVRRKGVIFPDSTGGFNSSKFCDVGHDIHIGKVDDMLKTPR